MRTLDALIHAFLDAARNAFNFKGRTSRKDFWLSVLAFLLIHGAAFCILRRLQANEEEIKCIFDASITSIWDDILDFYSWERFYFGYVCILSGVPFFSMTLRRLRDSGLSERWALAVWGIPCFALIGPLSAHLFVFFSPLYFLFLFIVFCRPTRKEKSTEILAVEPRIDGAFDSALDISKKRTAVGWCVSCLALCLYGLYTSQDYARERARASSAAHRRLADYRETPGAPFFYTINNRLKHAESVDPDAPTLFSGKKSSLSEDAIRVYPSPDERKAAVVSDEKLYLVQPGQATLLLLKKVDLSWEKLIFDEPWYRSAFLQWDAQSRHIYIVRDKKEFFSMGGFSRVFTGGFLWQKICSSEGAQLLRIDVENAPRAETRIDGFHGCGMMDVPYYFMVGEKDLCFFDLRKHDRSWRCTTPTGIAKMVSYEENEILLENGARLTGRQFVYGKKQTPSALWKDSLLKRVIDRRAEK
ncbi:MAG: DUF805 domain-containing protein [Candidatus Accumulibacter sp.]|jgi:uncharacterized membrane protein YhaH (DUF805 family)|nr:DUF805 domain-containing protein [Accumulibacter sp.]